MLNAYTHKFKLYVDNLLPTIFAMFVFSKYFMVTNSVNADFALGLLILERHLILSLNAHYATSLIILIASERSLVVVLVNMQLLLVLFVRVISVLVKL